MIQALGEPPNRQQIESVMHKMKNNKAPGDTGVTTDMIKHILTKVIQDFWKNPECDFNSWHVQKLITLYKGKGDPKDPNNWRRICLKEMTAKIVSIIIAERLLKQLGTTQFN